MSSDATFADDELPAVDEHLVTPETRYEILDGAVIYVPPALEPHGTRHSKVSALVETHVGPAFDVACDMLTRTSKTSDFAPDVSVFPRARNPKTGGRLLEQLAFEVVSTESLAHAGRKAAQLVARGVRRVFAIDVERERALEWSHELETWGVLDGQASIEDPALAAPLPIAALVGAASSDDANARALITKQNPEIESFGARRATEGRVEGRVEGRAEAVLEILAARDIAVTSAERTRVLDERDLGRLQRWIARATICSTAAELFAEA